MTGWLHFFFLARICHPPAIIRCLPCLVHESSLGFSSSWAPPPTEPTVSPPLVTHFLATPWLKGGKEIRTQWAKERSKAHPGCHVSKSTCSSYPHVLTFKSGLWSSAAAAAKSLQSCPTLCDPIESSPAGSPWDFPGKNTGVGCHFLLQRMKGESEVAQSCPTLCDPMDLQPTRLLCPWDFPGKSTGVGCHHLLCSGLLDGYKSELHLQLLSSLSFSFPLFPSSPLSPLFLWNLLDFRECIFIKLHLKGMD